MSTSPSVGTTTGVTDASVPAASSAAMGDRRHNADWYRQIDHWIFDLDNTLYPRSSNLFDQIDHLISSYVADLLELEPIEAQRVQKAYYRKYGTTLRGLIEEHGIEPDDFLDKVHDIDYAPVQPDPQLTEAIHKLPGRKYILTNGTTAHARRVTDRLGITEVFDLFFDITSGKLIPKPAEVTYGRFLHESGVDPKRAVMFEDLARNLLVPDALGMATVLVHPSQDTEHHAYPWELEGADEPYVHHRTQDLGAFLTDIVAHLE